jgi:hypothetical protein
VQFTDWGGADQQWQLVRVDRGSSALPSTFRWSSSGVLAGPKPDAQHPDVAAIKDFSVVRYNNQWLTFATTASPSGWGLVQFNFDDWSQAASAPHTYLDTSPTGPGYRAAPQVFYSAPQNLWYMVYQTGPPTYSTSTNPTDPRSWSAPRLFMSEGRRYFRSFTSTSLTGGWTPLADTENEPFASRNNVTFPGGVWTEDISHGEMVRAGNDQTLTINPCRLQYVYQGVDPRTDGSVDYIRLPWRMGLLTQTNSPC